MDKSRVKKRHEFSGMDALALITIFFLLLAPLPHLVAADVSPLPIYGYVTYAGVVIPDAKVEATNERTGKVISGTTGRDGAYTITFGGPVYEWEIGDIIKLKVKGTGDYECLEGEKEIAISSGEPIRADISLHLNINAEFSFSPEHPEVGDNISFSDLSTGKITNYTWNFGDGNVSYEKNPVHSYSSEGNYTVTLTVSCHSFSDSTSSLITVAKQEADNETDIGGNSSTSNGGSTPGFLFLSVLSGMAILVFLKRKNLK